MIYHPTPLTSIMTPLWKPLLEFLSPPISGRLFFVFYQKFSLLSLLLALRRKNRRAPKRLPVSTLSSMRFCLRSCLFVKRLVCHYMAHCLAIETPCNGANQDDFFKRQTQTQHLTSQHDAHLLNVNSWYALMVCYYAFFIPERNCLILCNFLLT